MNLDYSSQKVGTIDMNLEQLNEITTERFGWGKSGTLWGV